MRRLDGVVRLWPLCLLLCACVTRQDLAARLTTATTGDTLPELAACWEAEFEASGFRARYVAVLDFVVTGEGKLKDVEVRRMLDERSGDDAYEAAELKACIDKALEGKQLQGFEHTSDLPVTGYRIAFRDASKNARAAASKRAPTVLIGPRRERCKGLYGHDPPREMSKLAGELDRALADADAAKGSDRDRYARALQQSYDLALELRERLRLESKRDDLTEEGKKRMKKERRRATKIARDAGDKIGCSF